MVKYDVFSGKKKDLKIYIKFIATKIIVAVTYPM